MTIRFAEQAEYPQVLSLYNTCGYNGGLTTGDKIVIAVDNEIIGAVRLCIEHDVKTLRGMQIMAAWQRKGIGSLMLKYLAANIDMADCYCLPYSHLTTFYSLIGFKEIAMVTAPVFLAERLEKYLSNGLDTIIMHTGL